MIPARVFVVVVLSVFLVDLASSAAIPGDQSAYVVVRWCTDSDAAQKKCLAVSEAISKHEDEDHGEDHKVEEHNFDIECHQRDTR